MNHRVVLTGTDSNLLLDMQAELQKLGAQVTVCTEQIDRAYNHTHHPAPDGLQQFRTMQTEFTHAETSMGGFDTLVNVGIIRHVPRMQWVSAAQWHSAIAALTGTVGLRCATVLPFLQRQQGTKRIINVWLPSDVSTSDDQFDVQTDDVQLLSAHTQQLATAYAANDIQVLSLMFHQPTHHKYQQIPVWVRFFVSEPAITANGSMFRLGLVPVHRGDMQTTA